MKNFASLICIFSIIMSLNFITLEKTVMAATITPTNNNSDFLEDIANSKNPIGDHVIPIPEALNKFKINLGKNVSLPTYIPFKITHTGALYNENEKSLKLIYFNQNTNDKMIIYVVSNNNKIEGFQKHTVITLANGTKALYTNNDKFISASILFKKNDLDYNIGITKGYNGNILSSLSKVALSLNP